MSGIRMLAAFAVMMAGALMSACAGESADQSGVNDWNSLQITLERGVCFGACPDYTVTVHGDGRVVFEGRRFVAKEGRQEATISRNAVRALYAKFRAADFYALKDEYRAQVTDLPTYVVTLSVDGRTKRVLDYGGEMMGMPKPVTELQDAIDETAGTRQWVKG